jgi:hypothetical protein
MSKKRRQVAYAGSGRVKQSDFPARTFGSSVREVSGKRGVWSKHR